jgi:hypothetical protein
MHRFIFVLQFITTVLFDLLLCYLLSLVFITSYTNLLVVLFVCGLTHRCGVMFLTLLFIITGLYLYRCGTLSNIWFVFNVSFVLWGVTLVYNISVLGVKTIVVSFLLYFIALILLT